MNDKVIQLFPSGDIPETLRNIADGVESGEFECTGCTVILGTDIFQIGAPTLEKAAEQSIWDMTFGIHKLMKEALSYND